MDILGLSMDGHTYCGGGHPWTMHGWSQLLWHLQILGGGWTSLDYPWIVRVTLASTDTLTWGGGRVDIPGLSMDGHGYSGIHNTLTWGGRVDLPGLSMDGHSYSQLSTKELCHPWMAVDCLRHHWTYLFYWALFSHTK